MFLVILVPLTQRDSVLSNLVPLLRETVFLVILVPLTQGDSVLSNFCSLRGLHLKPPKFDLSCHNFPPLSSVQILLLPACCLLCVL